MFKTQGCGFCQLNEVMYENTALQFYYFLDDIFVQTELFEQLKLKLHQEEMEGCDCFSSIPARTQL